jgi:hypothetical protein
MKKWLTILFLFLSTGFATLAQNEDPQQDGGGKIQDRMNEYIQNKLGLSRTEAEKFNPVFVHYFRDFVQTHKENRGDRLILQQRIIELRLRYRGEFKQILDEQRANKVYVYEDEFRKKALDIIRETRRERMETRPLRRNRAMFR